MVHHPFLSVPGCLDIIVLVKCTTKYIVNNTSYIYIVYNKYILMNLILEK